MLQAVESRPGERPRVCPEDVRELMPDLGCASSSRCSATRCRSPTPGSSWKSRCGPGGCSARRTRRSVCFPGVTMPGDSGDGAPRIAPAPPQGNPEELQSLLDTLGRPPRPAANLFLTLARHPVLLRDWLPLGSRLLLGGSLPPRDRELVILRTAWLCGCEYEWGHHVRIGARADLTDDEVADVRDPSAARWSGHDAAVLRGTGELVHDHTVSQATWDTLAQTYDDAALIEFTMLAGHYVMLAGLLNAARVTRDAAAGFPPSPGPA